MRTLLSFWIICALILNDVQEKWLGTLTSVPNKGEKVPRHAPACLIGCAAYVGVARGVKRVQVLSLG